MFKRGTKFNYRGVQWTVTETHADFVIAESWQRWSMASHSCVKTVKKFPKLFFDLVEILA